MLVPSGRTVEVPPSPSGGPILVLLLNIIEAYPLSAVNLTQDLYYHRLVEVSAPGFLETVQGKRPLRVYLCFRIHWFRPYSLHSNCYSFCVLHIGSLFWATCLTISNTLYTLDKQLYLVVMQAISYAYGQRSQLGDPSPLFGKDVLSNQAIVTKLVMPSHLNWGSGCKYHGVAPVWLISLILTFFRSSNI